jgi:tRNA(fMet)-specific endonuclease VapC
VTPAPLYLLDTNTVSYLVSGRSPAARRTYLETEPHARIALSAITEAEIRFGLQNKPQATRLRATFEEFFASIQILPWNSDTARACGKLRARLNVIGKSLSLMDLLIASHAFATDAILVSHDHAFHHLAPFLTVVDWATDLQVAPERTQTFP